MQGWAVRFARLIGFSTCSGAGMPVKVLGDVALLEPIVVANNWAAVPSNRLQCRLRANKPRIDSCVFSRRGAPAEIARHAVPLQSAPDRRVARRCDTALDRADERLCCGGEEDEACRSSVGERLRCAVYDRIDQSPCRMDDRWRSVALAVHLVHPAWLESRWHHEGIGTGLDKVRQRLVEADEASDAARVRGRERAQPMLERLVSHTKHDDLRRQSDDRIAD